jgi:hypothetical protein
LNSVFFHADAYHAPCTLCNSVSLASARLMRNTQ